MLKDFKKKIVYGLYMTLFSLLFIFPSLTAEAKTTKVGEGKNEVYTSTLPGFFVDCDQVISGSDIYEWPEGTHVQYDWFYNANGTFSFTSTFAPPLYQMNDKKKITFDDNYDAIMFKMYLMIDATSNVYIGDSSTTPVNHMIEEMYICGFGQEYPVNVFYNSKTGRYSADITAVFYKDGSENQIKNPSCIYFKIKSTMSVDGFAELTVLEVQPVYKFEYGHYSCLYAISDVDSREKQFVGQITAGIENILLGLDDVEEAIKDITESNKNDSSVINNFKEDSNSQTVQIGDLNQQTSVEKIDVNNAVGLVDSNIDMASVGNYGVLLSSITGNQNVGRLILISLTVSLIAYIFFGKR